MQGTLPRTALAMALMLAVACGPAPGRGPDDPEPPASSDPATGPTDGSASTSPSTGPAESPQPRFVGVVLPITEAVRARMTESWRPGCPVPLADLRLLQVTHWGFDGRPHRGELVVHAAHARAVLGVFRSLFRGGFPIERVRLVDEYGADDDASMAANNTSAFNCRAATDGSSWSEHAYGRAIDINPVQNPYVTPDGTVLPPAGRPYVDRSRRGEGMIHGGEVVVRAFAAIGWAWGGDWTSLKDYQHFSSTGR